ncbi:MAG: ABC transporter permease [Actinomycetes bacterium]
MAAVSTAVPLPVTTGFEPRPRRGGRVVGTARVVIFVLFAAYYLMPVVAAFEFTVRGTTGYNLSSWAYILSQPDLTATLGLSLKIAVGTIAISLLLMVPTVVWVHLRAPRLRRVIEAVSVLPLVIPAVVLVVGVLSAFQGLPNVIKGTPVILSLEYVILAMPYTYRVLDSGVGAIDLKTLVEAARGLGASWLEVLLRVIVPNLRSSILFSAFLTLALVLGEFTMASLMLFNTFPVWIVQVGQSQAQGAVAVSIFSLVFAWFLLFAFSLLGARRRGSRRRRSA